MLNKSDEINILTYKYMKDAVDSIEEELEVLRTLQNIVGFKHTSSVECTEFIQSHVRLLRKFINTDIEKIYKYNEEHHGK